MAQLYGVDVSEFQGTINWDQLNSVSNFVIIRSSFGTKRRDLQFNRNQSEARRVQASAGPLGIGYYYFAYPTLIDATESANFFIYNLGGLQEGEVLALDLEGEIGGAPVAWSLRFLQQCEARCGVKPLIYINQSILNGYNWTPVINNGNGLWIAQYDGNQKAPGVSGAWPFAAMKQWTDAASVAGIWGLVDGDTFYGDFDAFARYGFHTDPPASTTTLPPPQPEPTQTTTTTDTTTTTTLPTTTTTSTLPPEPGPDPLPVPPPLPSQGPFPILSRLVDAIIAWIKNLFNRRP